MDREFCQNVCKNVIDIENGDLRCVYYQEEIMTGIHNEHFGSEEEVVVFEKEYLPEKCPYKLEATVLELNKEEEQ